MKKEKYGRFMGIGIVIIMMASILTFGCNNGDSESLGVDTGMPGTVPGDVAAVGMDVCTFCHDRQVLKWLDGAHGNQEAINHANHQPLDLGLDSEGFPYYGYFDDETCAGCHDPLGDGYLLEADFTGNVPRPVIGCESCHGGGAEHFGIGQIPYPKPGPDQCGQCHNSSFPDGHLAYHPNGQNIVEEYLASPHSRSINEHNYDDATGLVRAKCGRCHTDEGFKLYAQLAPGTLGHDALSDYFTNLPPLAESSVVQCATCHNGHITGPEQYEVLDASTLAGNAQSSQFNTCTACHQLNATDGLVLSGATGGAYHDPVANAYGDLGEIITDSHAAVPGDTRLNTGNTVEALYFVNKGESDSCAGCHNPHSADTTVNRQYARSGHGNPLAEAWIHYDWKHTGRGACQRCHTSTGFKNYADSLRDGSTYDAANNDYSYLAGNNAGSRIDTDDQMEALYCWACHTDYKGGLRDPGPITADYPAMDGSTVIMPDFSGSNVCSACHTGRTGGNAIATKTGMTNGRFSNSHYLAAAGVLNRAVGFNYDFYYPLLDYTNVSYYAHDLIGSAAYPETGSNGPCVGCHMTTNPEKHLFSPVSHDSGSMVLTSTGCAVCHTTHPMTSAILEEEEHHYHDALDALLAQLTARTYPYLGGYPYFSQGDWTLDSTNASTGNDVVGQKNMGAAFNYNLLHHEPGAFAHNRYYAKRLIYDSIDWLDNNFMDESVAGTLPTLGLSADVLANVQGYLLNSGGGRP